MAPSLRLTLEYDGAEFAGWQRQPAPARTVQGTLEAALARVTGQRARAVASGRTDAGVHAEGQVVSVALDGRLDPGRLRGALNGVLPADVAVLEVRPAPDGFDARRHALAKRYRYRIWNGPVRSPLRAPRALCLQRRLELDAMRRAAGALVGTHDFASFQAAGAGTATSVRTLLGLELDGAPGACIELLAEGTGFLRHMVRILAGTLLAVGSGRLAPEEMPALLAARDRRLAGPTAPAHALTLVAVRCAGDPPWEALGASAASNDSIARSTC